MIARSIWLLWMAMGLMSCMIRSERDMCYMDISYGEKSDGFSTPCEDLALLSGLGYQGTPELEVLHDCYLLLCASTILEAQKCESKSNWIPKIDTRM